MKTKYRKLQKQLESIPVKTIIKKGKQEAVEQEIKIDGEKGLVLRIGKTGRKVFSYYYTDTDKIRRKHKIGLFDPTGVEGYWLERAVAEAEELRVNFR